MADIQREGRLARLQDHSTKGRQAACQDGDDQHLGDKRIPLKDFQKSHCPLLRLATFTRTVSAFA